MNYEDLFTNTDTVQGRKFTLRKFDCHGPVQLNSQERHPALFVLAGTLLLFSDHTRQEGFAPQMLFVDRTRLTDLFCTKGTILLEYDLPEELTRHFESAFTTPYTPLIPITGRLEEWVEKLLAQHPCKTGSEAPNLVELLLRYQSRKLQPLCQPMKQYAEEVKWKQWKNSNPTIEERSLR